MSRFDNRSENKFKKDIKFGTALESYFFQQWLKVTENSDYFDVAKWSDNGCGNDGEFIASGNTAGADYMVSGSVSQADIPGMSDEYYYVKDCPLEMKWVPTAGKFTLKENDLKAYVQEKAAILFIYNTAKGGVNLRKPNDYDMDKHIERIEAKRADIKWGIMWADAVKHLYEDAKEYNKFEPISYMGNKSGIILQSEDFSDWFFENEWTTPLTNTE